MNLGSPHAATRRYTLGIFGVAALGVVMLLVYVKWSSSAISSALQASLESRARHAAEAYRDKLTRELRGRDPASPQTWAVLDVTLEDAFQGLPNLVGITVSLPDATETRPIGPRSILKFPFLPPPSDGGMNVVTTDAAGGNDRATVSFLVPAGAAPSRAAHVNVHLELTPLAELESGIFQWFQVGVVLVAVVIYILAALALIIDRQGNRAEIREREKAVRLKAIGDVAGAIAHELRNPLNAISLSFQVIGENLKRSGNLEAARSQDLERARGEVAKISKVVDNFVSFARLSDMNVTEFEFAGVVREAFDGMAAACAEFSVRPEFVVTGQTTMRGDREKIGQAVGTTLQAVLDGVKATPGALEVEVLGRPREVELRIRGHGERVDSRRISNFASSRRAWDEPVGLGLTIARTWIDLHGGTVTGATLLPDKTELAIVLPKGFV